MPKTSYTSRSGAFGIQPCDQKHNDQLDMLRTIDTITTRGANPGVDAQKDGVSRSDPWAQHVSSFTSLEIKAIPV